MEAIGVLISYFALTNDLERTIFIVPICHKMYVFILRGGCVKMTFTEQESS